MPVCLLRGSQARVFTADSLLRSFRRSIELFFYTPLQADSMLRFYRESIE